METLLEEAAEDVYDQEQVVVLEWRVETLRRAGFDAASALDLALCRHVDLHSAVCLVERGCPVDTALQILL
jgi:hypothetical protein